MIPLVAIHTHCIPHSLQRVKIGIRKPFVDLCKVFIVSQCYHSVILLTRELLASALEEVLDADALLLGDAGRETESLDAAAHADAEISSTCENGVISPTARKEAALFDGSYSIEGRGTLVSTG